jgi:hypothetical protein
MKVYHADLDEAQADPALAALFAPGPGVTPFDRLEWLQLLAGECLAPARCFIAVAREGEAIAALPLCEAPASLTALANWYSFIARPRGTSPHLLEAIMRSLAGNGAIDFAPLPAAEAAMLHNAARAAGWFARLTPVDRNHVLEPGGADFAGWWATRPGHLRETVRRKARRITIRIARQFDPADWASYEAIYAKSWKPAEGSPAFLRRLAEAEGAAGRLRLGLACIDAMPVAAQFWTVEDASTFIHKLAHDPAADAHSPGTVLTQAMFAAAIDQDRVKLIDFGTGDDPYKRDWVNTVRLRYRLEACHPRALRHWPKLGKLVAKSALHFWRSDDKAAP